MHQRPSRTFYVVAFTALTFSIASLLLSLQTRESGYAAAAGVVAALGYFACARMLKRRR
jgi:hypothetical protein